MKIKKVDKNIVVSKLTRAIMGKSDPNTVMGIAIASKIDNMTNFELGEFWQLHFDESIIVEDKK